MTVLKLSLLGALLFACSAPAAESPWMEQQKENVKIKITSGCTVLTAFMYDNPTARDFISLLPITTRFDDFAGKEKIFYPERALSTEGAPKGYEPSAGDLTYYAPWGDIALFYEDFGYASGLISMGKLDKDGAQLLKNLKSEPVTIELITE